MRFEVPNSFDEALDSPQQSQWIRACRNEMQTLYEEKMFEEVHTDLVNGPILDAHWKFDVSDDPGDINAGFEAKIHVKGYEQVHGVHYDETYSPTVTYDTLKMVIASIAATGDGKIFQFRINNYLLQGAVDRVIYLNPPWGTETKQNHLWRLNYCMPGMKQANRQAYICLRDFLQGKAFRISDSDPCLFIRGRCYAMIYADIVIVASTDVNGMYQLENSLRNRFSIEYLTYDYENDLSDSDSAYDVAEKTTSILGLTLHFRPNEITISMKGAIQRALNEHNMNVHSSAPLVPLPVCIDIEDTNSAFLSENSTSEFKSLLGKLIFIQSKLRDDVTVVVKALSQCIINPRVNHLDAAKKVLYYLGYTIESGMNFKYLPPSDSDNSYDSDNY
ncbi:hypothetical protein B5S32_g459 [[Candida] boidinii]|nr:hypothetical protein B5S32_g459 [[Candida] boidinii]